MENSSEALEDWITKLEGQANGLKIAVCLEQCNGMLLYKFIDRPVFEVYSLNPAMAASYREAFFPSKVKDDPVDSELLLEMVIMHRDRLRIWEPDTELTRALGTLSKQRRDIVNHRVKLVLRLYAELKRFYPQALELCGGRLDTKMSCDFLKKWPSTNKIKKERASNIRKFYYAHHCRSETLVSKRIESIKGIKNVSNEELIILASELKIQELASEIYLTTLYIEKYEKHINKLFEQHEDSAIFASFPGAGAAMAPRILAALGSKRDNFKKVEDLQAYTGIAPVIIRSGKKSIIHRRVKCSKFLLQTFHEFAGHSIAYSSWARAYYEEAKKRGVRHNMIIRSLAFKWLRIIYRCWKDRTIYNEEMYINNLQKKGVGYSLEIPSISS